MPDMAPKSAEIAPECLTCIYCNKKFTHKPSMHRHRCKKNIQLNIIKQKDEIIKMQQKLLSQRPNHTTINNTTNNTVNIQNIVAYKDTDTEKIHFNPMKPESKPYYKFNR